MSPKLSTAGHLSWLLYFLMQIILYTLVDPRRFRVFVEMANVAIRYKVNFKI